MNLKGNLRHQIFRWLGRRLDQNYFLDNIQGLIHVGVNLGQERLLYASKHLSVLWVEPIPSIYEQLLENISPYSNQRAAKALLLDEDGIQARLNISNNEGASSSVLPFKDHTQLWPDVEYVDTLLIESQTLPKLLESMSLCTADYQALVMDTQGSELLILKGSLSILENIRYIKTEVPDFEAYENCPRLAEFTSFMKSQGYRLSCKSAFASSPGLGTYFDVVYERK